MFKPSVRRFLNGLLGRSDELQAAKCNRRRMKLERLEDRDVPSTAIRLNGGQWTEMGPRPILAGEALGAPTATGRFDSIGIPQVAPGVTFDKTYPNLYAASAVGGIWTSTNNGLTWTPRTDKLDPTGATTPVNSATLIRAVQRDNDLGTKNDTVYAASSSGGGGFLYLSTDNGENFTRLGVTAFDKGRQINEFVVIPGATQAQDLIYAAVSKTGMGPAGIYRSADGGVNWVNITANGFPFAQVGDLVFSDIDVDPTNTNVVFASVNADPATQSAVGVYRCKNAFDTDGMAGMKAPQWELRLGGGSVFSATLPSRLQTVIAPNLPSTLFVSVAAGAIYGVYQSNDTGINWTPYLTTTFGGNVPDYALASGAGFGATYSRIMVDPTSPLNPNQQIVIAAGAGDDDDGSQTINNQIIRSNNSGSTWTNLTFNGDGTPGMLYFGVRDMQFDRMNRVVAATEGGLFRLEPSALVLGTSVWKSLNGAAGIGNTNGTGAINTTQVNAFGQAIHPFDPNQAMINDGPFHSAAKFNNVPAWQTIDSRTAPWFHINPVPLPHFSEQMGNANILYDFNNPLNQLRVAAGGVRRSIDGGNTWDFANVPFGAPGAFVPDPSDSRRYYSSNPFDDVYIYDLLLDATAPLEAFLGFRLPSLDFFPLGANPGNVTAIGVSRQSNLIYVATTEGIYESEIQTDPPVPPPAPRSRLYVISPNGIPNAAGAPQFDWIELSLPVAVSGNTTGTVPPDYINQIIVDPNNPFNVFFKTQNAQTIYNMRSANINWMAPPPQPNPGPPTFMGPNPVAAIATINWQQINLTGGGNQPPTFTRAASTGVTVMTYDPNIGTNPNDDVIYIGTNYGVYSHPINRTQTNNFIWTRVGGDELPNNAVRDLDINTTTGILSVGLNGRGVWQFQIRTLVEGQVFTDLNGDGDVASDAPRAGIVVELVDAAVTPNQVVATTVSDAQGRYFFRSVPAGTYSVRTNLPSNLVRTTQNVSSFTVTLRDVVFPTPNPIPNPVPPLTIYRDGMNIGVFERGSIRGVKFDDLNQNGVRDPGEGGVAGFTIYVDLNNNGMFEPTEPNDITDLAGSFELLDLGPASINGVQQPNTTAPNYIIREVQQPGWTQTLPTVAMGGFYTLTINSNSQLTGVQFGNFRAGAISGVKFLDANSNARFDAGESRLQNWRIFIDANGNDIFDVGETNVLTDVNGVFQFIGLPAGSYRIREQQQAGFIQTTPNPANVVLTGTNSDNSILFGNVPLADFRLINGWTAIGPQPQLNGSGIGNPTVSGRVNAITTDPTNPNRYFIATAGGGLWRTLNAGASWTPLTDNIPGLSVFQTSPYTDSIVMSPSNPNILFAAQGDSPGGTPGHGLLKSTDGGNTWALIQGPGNSFDGTVVPRIVFDRLDSNIVFAVINGGGGVMRTTDGGLNWTSISNPDPLVSGRFFSDIQVDPLNPNVVYAAAGGIYRTSNALSASPTWTLMIGGSAFVPGALPGNIRLAIAPSQPSTIYAAIARTPDADGKSRYLATYKSNDSGVNWTNLVNAPDYMGTQGDYDLTIIVAPTNPNVVIASGVGTGPAQSTNLVVMTNDGGITWRDGIAGSGAVLGPHTDSHALAFDASGRLLIGTDGGMFRLNNATLPGPTFIPPYNGAIPNWVSLNGNINVAGGLNTIQFVGVATHPTDPNKVAGGSQDNGLALFTGNIAWDTKAGGDRGVTVWDFDRPENVYNAAPIASVGTNSYISKSTDGGNTWQDATNGIQGQTGQNTLFYPDIIIDPNNSMRLFTGTDKVWVTDDGALNWSQTTKYDNVVDVMIPDTPLSGMSPPIPIVTLAVTRVPDTLIYVSQGGSLFRLQLFFPFPTPPATTDWVDVTPPGGGPSKIITDPTNPLALYVISGGVIFRTTNAGATWTPLDGALLNPNRLPAIGTNTLALDTRIATNPLDDILYAGTEDGVWALFNPTNPDVSWYRVGDQNLPNTSVRDLDLNTTTGLLTVGTYGRGAWQTRIRGTIQGQVFEDLNGNGNFDSGEPVQAGVTVRLLDATPGGSNGAELATTITDAFGNYRFQSLRAGNYRIVQVSPTGQVQTTANPSDLINFTEQSLATPTFTGTVVPGITVDIRYTFGNFRTGNISGVKFEDRNANGVRDTGEPGLANFVIFSDLNGDGIRQWTDGNGNNIFDPGEGETWTTTATDGSYLLSGFGPPVLLGVPQTAPPFFIREIQQPNFTQTSTNPAGITVQSGQNFSGINFGNIRNGRLSGAIFNDLNGNGIHDAGDPGVPNATLNLIDTSTGSIIRTLQSDASGNYTFFSLAPGTYEIREVVPTGWIQTFPVAPNPTFYTATIIGGGQLGGFEFGNFKLFTVSGVKFEDSNGDGTRQSGEAGVPGFTIRLTNTNTGAIITNVTDAFGAYSFPNLGPGNYTIAEVQKTGWTQTSATPAGFQGISGTNRTGRDFGNFRFITATGNVFNDVNGNGIRDVGEVGIGGITVRLDRDSNGSVDATALTDSSGNYSFPTLGPGNYTITTAPRKGFIITTPVGGSFVFSAVSSTNPTGLDFGVRSAGILVAGQDAGSGPLVTVRDPLTKVEKFSFLAYTPSFRGGVRVAEGYVNGTTTPQIVTAPGPGGGPHVRVWNSQTGLEEWGFFAYDSRFTGGVYIAVGDVNGDGFDDIITGAGPGGGPHVRVWSGQTHQELFGFFAYTASFTGGVRVGAADVDGDGKADIITGAGPGGGPHVKVFSGANRTELKSFFAFDGGFRGGVFVAGGDFNKDGKADIAVSADAGGGSHAKIFNGTNLAVLGEVFGFESSFRGGTRVAVMDTNFDNNLDLVLGAGPGRRPDVKDFTLVNGSLQLLSTFTAFDPTFLGGVFVG